MYIFCVPNQRAAGQKQIIVMMRSEFLRVIDDNLERMGYSDRASFIRDAVAAKLKKEGINVDMMLKTAPSRAGKGGRPKKDELQMRVAEDPAEYQTKKGQPKNDS